MKSVKTSRKAPQAKGQVVRIPDAILIDANAENMKPIRPFDLRQLGYIFNDTPKTTFTGTGYELRMVLDEDTKREVDFSFLLAIRSNVGLVLPHPFTHYKEAAGE